MEKQEPLHQLREKAVDSSLELRLREDAGRRYVEALASEGEYRKLRNVYRDMDFPESVRKLAKQRERGAEKNFVLRAVRDAKKADASIFPEDLGREARVFGLKLMAKRFGEENTSLLVSMLVGKKTPKLARQEAAKQIIEVCIKKNDLDFLVSCLENEWVPKFFKKRFLRAANKVSLLCLERAVASNDFMLLSRIAHHPLLPEETKKAAEKSISKAVFNSIKECVEEGDFLKLIDISSFSEALLSLREYSENSMEECALCFVNRHIMKSFEENHAKIRFFFLCTAIPFYIKELAIDKIFEKRDKAFLYNIALMPGVENALREKAYSYLADLYLEKESFSDLYSLATEQNIPLLVRIKASRAYLDLCEKHGRLQNIYHASKNPLFLDEAKEEAIRKAEHLGIELQPNSKAKSSPFYNLMLKAGIASNYLLEKVVEGLVEKRAFATIELMLNSKTLKGRAEQRAAKALELDFSAPSEDLLLDAKGCFKKSHSKKEKGRRVKLKY